VNPLIAEGISPAQGYQQPELYFKELDMKVVCKLMEQDKDYTKENLLEHL
jgi:hypothetical protein